MTLVVVNDEVAFETNFTYSALMIKHSVDCFLSESSDDGIVLVGCNLSLLPHFDDYSAEKITGNGRPNDGFPRHFCSF